MATADEPGGQVVATAANGKGAVGAPHGPKLRASGLARWPGTLLLTLFTCLAGRVVPVSAGLTSESIRASILINRLVARMSLTQKVGQMFMVPNEGAGTDQLIKRWQAGGLILYQADVASAAQGAALIAADQRAAPLPLLVATDDEGGEVSQIAGNAGVPEMLSAEQYGAIGSARRVYQDAVASGRVLRALGVNMDLAPVLDVLVDPSSAIGDRSYGSDPKLVARLGVAAIHGLQHAGLAATAKHFLGLGSVSTDEHLSLPVVTRAMRQLEGAELVPMRAAIRAGVDALMVTHTVVKALDPTGTPASLSRRIVSGFIRGRLGFGGVIITDSLAMGGLSAHIKSIASAAVQAVQAGNDMVLISADAPTIQGALDAVTRAVQRGRISVATIDSAVRHILELKVKLGLLPDR